MRLWMLGEREHRSQLALGSVAEGESDAVAVAYTDSLAYPLADYFADARPDALPDSEPDPGPDSDPYAHTAPYPHTYSDAVREPAPERPGSR